MSFEQDLWQDKIETEVAKRLKVEVEQILNDPELLLERWAADRREVNRLKPYEEPGKKYLEFLDADGYIDAAEAAGIVCIEYIPPDGKTTTMGRNYFLNVLCGDGFLVRAANGYRLSSSAQKDALGITRVVNRNGMIKSVALFNADGLDRLITRYAKDTRVWHSTSDHQLYWEQT
jgi:hypothetical protein